MDSTSAPKTGEIHEDKPSGGAIEEPTQLEEVAAPPRDNQSEPEVKAKTGRAKRKEKRLRHEPQNVTGERQCTTVNYMHVGTHHDCAIRVENADLAYYLNCILL